MVSETLVLMEGINEASSRMTSGLETSMGSIRHTVDGVGDNLRGVSDSLSSRMAEMEESNERLAAALASTSDKVSEASDRLHAGVRSQASTEQAIQQLSSSVSDFGNRLDELRDAHAALAPVLNKLMGPLELRIAPVSSVKATLDGSPGDAGGSE